MGTRGAWARDFLVALGNTSPSGDTIKLVAAWTRVENTRAIYNPLATTFDNGDTTKFNSVGVKNYKTRQAGIDASVKTLSGNFTGYEGLREGLKTNDPQRALASFGFDTWGSHTNKVLGTYLAGDYTEEPLKSEESGSVSGGAFGEGTQSAQEPMPERSRPTEEQTAPQFGEVTEQDIRNIAKMFLGILFIVAGGIVFIVGIMKTDTAQQTIGTAAKVLI